VILSTGKMLLRQLFYFARRVRGSVNFGVKVWFCVYSFEKLIDGFQKCFLAIQKNCEIDHLGI